jgi:hypothetical protein
LNSLDCNIENHRRIQPPGLVSCGCNYDDCWGSCAPKSRPQRKCWDFSLRRLREDQEPQSILLEVYERRFPAGILPCVAPSRRHAAMPVCLVFESPSRAMCHASLVRSKLWERILQRPPLPLRLFHLFSCSASKHPRIAKRFGEISVSRVIWGLGEVPSRLGLTSCLTSSIQDNMKIYDEHIWWKSGWNSGWTSGWTHVEICSKMLCIAEASGLGASLAASNPDTHQARRQEDTTCDTKTHICTQTTFRVTQKTTKDI